jgi:hypothetical protein
MTFDGFEWLIVLYIPAVFYVDWRSKNYGKRDHNLCVATRNRVRDRLEKWKDRFLMDEQKIKYNDPRIINAVYRHDPILAMIIERWDELSWYDRKRIWWISIRCYWQNRLTEAWQRICRSFLEL